ncbi:MAG: pyruvate:ferredoxin (flavodoxin) oxidoreductase, partial [Candidatus Eisenbacteria bacterium]|nr:pyruvate:ferredoxin (flavodoxin) oxidoreductase [Candidatus Eisenbacteria bacterium]
VAALPPTVRQIAVLDRTKEPGAPGEPLYLDVVTALAEEWRRAHPQTALPAVIGGRYGLSSKEFHSGHVDAVFGELGNADPKNHFTVGIVDDVTHTSLPPKAPLPVEADSVFRGLFYGLGSDGTVGANKNSIKILGDTTDFHAQGYFVYDSKKAGAVTVSHLRFGPEPIRSTYLIEDARFVAVHQWQFLDRFDVLEHAQPGAVLLLNAPFKPEQVWDRLPRELQEGILEKELQVHAIDAYEVARELGLGRRINTIMQTAFFAISGVLPRAQALTKIKEAIRKTYGKQGEEIVRRNEAAVDRAADQIHRIDVPAQATATRRRPPLIRDGAPDFVERVTRVLMAGQGDLLPVSAFPPDGTWPSATARWEKRNLALEIPVWDPAICIQCNKCTLVCPHAAIRAKVYEPVALDGAPRTFRSVDLRSNELKGMKYTIQVAPEDCTGCTLCARVCPARDKSNPRHKALNMESQPPLRERERESFAFFLELPQTIRGSEAVRADGTRQPVRIDVKGSQLLEPLFEFSGACAGCGETPYLKLLTQLFGDRLLIANATGCSSIYGGNLPTTPYAINADGRGPAWSNSLFEDNAEFGLGFRLSLDQATGEVRELLRQSATMVGDTLTEEILASLQQDETEIRHQRERVALLRTRIQELESRGEMDRRLARRLYGLSEHLVHRSVWIVGGDGWAYDIGFGGVDHVLSLERNINLLVLDTEVYSNTGGQASKATPMGATAKFAMGGKAVGKKDLGLMAMAYGHVYVAQVALGAKDAQTVRALQEADSYPGPSLVIAYSSCIAHGYDMADSLDHQKMASESGLWPLYRFDPRRSLTGENPLQLESKTPTIPFAKFAETETRFKMLMKANPARAKELLSRADRALRGRYGLYEQLSHLHLGAADATPSAEDSGSSNGKGGASA